MTALWNCGKTSLQKKFKVAYNSFCGDSVAHTMIACKTLVLVAFTRMAEVILTLTSELEMC